MTAPAPHGSVAYAEFPDTRFRDRARSRPRHGRGRGAAPAAAPRRPHFGGTAVAVDARLRGAAAPCERAHDPTAPEGASRDPSDQTGQATSVRPFRLSCAQGGAARAVSLHPDRPCGRITGIGGQDRRNRAGGAVGGRGCKRSTTAKDEAASQLAKADHAMMILWKKPRTRAA